MNKPLVAFWMVIAAIATTGWICWLGWRERSLLDYYFSLNVLALPLTFVIATSAGMSNADAVLVTMVAALFVAGIVVRDMIWDWLVTRPRRD